MAPNQELKALGGALAEIQEHALATRRRAPESERLSAIHRVRAHRALVLRRLAIGTPLAIAALVASLLFALSFQARPLGFVVGASRTPGQLGVWVASATAEPTAVSFSDGSQMLLRSGAQARVVSTSAHGARVIIERGTVRTEVVPRASNDWFVVGGPFEIHVTGTSFEASWEPERRTLRITMYEGHVLIRADCLGALRSLRKGESATLSCAPDLAESTKGATPSPTLAQNIAAPNASSLPRAPPQAPHGPRSDLPSAASSPALSSPEPAYSWRALAEQGKYKAALEAVERAGFDDACRSLAPGELLQLGTTARLAGNAARAQSAYSAVRGRFAGSDSAASAAFHLGQIAFDNDKACAEARNWFATYLSERPAGALAAEALGRELEAEQCSGKLAAARALAESYLARYPTGAHARLARSLLEP